MPANHKVSVEWQIVFTFLPIVNFWAFYRIRRLRRYLLYVFVPEITISMVTYVYILANTAPQIGVGELDNVGSLWVYISLNVIGFAIQGFAVYFVIIWSRLHNRRVDASTGQAPPT